MKNFFALALFAGVISAKSLNPEENEQRKQDQKEFIEYMKQWGKEFKNEEEKREHMDNWKANKKIVEKLNSNTKSKAHFKINDMADENEEEIKNRKGLEM